MSFSTPSRTWSFSGDDLPGRLAFIAFLRLLIRCVKSVEGGIPLLLLSFVLNTN
jgi:hypothetical protein